MSAVALWLIAGTVATFDLILLNFSNFSLSWPPQLLVLTGTLVLGVLWWIYTFARPVPALARLACTVLTYVLYTNALAILSYLLTGLVHRPLQDQLLVDIDHRLGFDWQAYHRWFAESSSRWMSMKVLYNGLGPELVVLMLLLDPVGRHARARELAATFVLASFLTVFIGAVFPATGAFVHFGMPEAHTAAYVKQYLGLRDGQLRRIDISNAQGLVWCPSFHAALATLCAYAARGIRRLFAPLLVLNIGIILVTPVGGGHYLADVLSGLGLALAVIMLVRYNMKIEAGALTATR